MGFYFPLGSIPLPWSELAAEAGAGDPAGRGAPFGSIAEPSFSCKRTVLPAVAVGTAEPGSRLSSQDQTRTAKPFFIKGLGNPAAHDGEGATRKRVAMKPRATKTRRIGLDIETSLESAG
jgi:hypothetical protein